MAATAALPTLSQVQTLDTAYLHEAAQHWTRTANLWEQAFTEVHEQMSSPGGLDVGGTRLNEEIVNCPPALQPRRPLLLRTNQHREKSRHPIGVHDQQHRVVAKVKLPSQFGANDGHTAKLSHAQMGWQ